MSGVQSLSVRITRMTAEFFKPTNESQVELTRYFGEKLDVGMSFKLISWFTGGSVSRILASSDLDTQVNVFNTNEIQMNRVRGIIYILFRSFLWGLLKFGFPQGFLEFNFKRKLSWCFLAWLICFRITFVSIIRLLMVSKQ